MYNFEKTIMIDTLLPSYKTGINIRPVKYAYFVLSDDQDEFIRILRFVCTQWGGIRSLIIPVNRNITIAQIFKYLLTLNEPDVFVSYLSPLKACPSKENTRLQHFLNSLWPYKKIVLQIGDSFEKYDSTAHPLHVISEKDLREQKLTVYKFAGSPKEQLFLLALFGAIYPGQENDYSKIIDLYHKKITIDSKDLWKNQFDNNPFSSPLNITAYGVSPYQAINGDESNTAGVPHLEGWG